MVNVRFTVSTPMVGYRYGWTNPNPNLIPNSNPVPNPILNVATVKTTFTFMTALTSGMPLTAVN